MKYIRVPVGGQGLLSEHSKVIPGLHKRIERIDTLPRCHASVSGPSKELDVGRIDRQHVTVHDIAWIRVPVTECVSLFLIFLLSVIPFF